MHECYLTALRHVGMGVDVVGLAVCGPAGVGYAERAFGASGGCGLLEVGHLAACLVYVERAVAGHECHAG